MQLLVKDGEQNQSSVCRRVASFTLNDNLEQKGTRPNDEHATLWLSERLTCLRKPTRTYIRDVASALFIPRQENRLHSLTSENLPRLLVHVQVAHRRRPSQNQPYVEYANLSRRESLATNPCVVEINCVQKFETRQTSASCMTACYFKTTKAPIKASRDCFLTSRTTRVKSTAMDVCKTIGNGRRERASELQKSRYRIHEEPLQNEQTKHKTSSGHETKSGAKIEKTTCAIL